MITVNWRIFKCFNSLTLFTLGYFYFCSPVISQQSCSSQQSVTVTVSSQVSHQMCICIWCRARGVYFMFRVQRSAFSYSCSCSAVQLSVRAEHVHHSPLCSCGQCSLRWVTRTRAHVMHVLKLKLLLVLTEVGWRRVHIAFAPRHEPLHGALPLSLQQVLDRAA